MGGRSGREVCEIGHQGYSTDRLLLSIQPQGHSSYSSSAEAAISISLHSAIHPWYFCALRAVLGQEEEVVVRGGTSLNVAGLQLENKKKLLRGRVCHPVTSDSAIPPVSSLIWSQEKTWAGISNNITILYIYNTIVAILVSDMIIIHPFSYVWLEAKID